MVEGGGAAGRAASAERGEAGGGEVGEFGGGDGVVARVGFDDAAGGGDGGGEFVAFPELDREVGEDPIVLVRVQTDALGEPREHAGADVGHEVLLERDGGCGNEEGATGAKGEDAAVVEGDGEGREEAQVVHEGRFFRLCVSA